MALKIIEKLKQYLNVSVDVSPDGDVYVFVGTEIIEHTPSGPVFYTFPLDIETFAQSLITQLTRIGKSLPAYGIRSFGVSLTPSLERKVFDNSVLNESIFYDEKELNDIMLISNFNQAILNHSLLRLETLIEGLDEKETIAAIRGATEFCLPLADVYALAVFELLQEVNEYTSLTKI